MTGFLLSTISCHAKAYADGLGTSQKAQYSVVLTRYHKYVTPEKALPRIIRWAGRLFYGLESWSTQSKWQKGIYFGVETGVTPSVFAEYLSTCGADFLCFAQEKRNTTSHFHGIIVTRLKNPSPLHRSLKHTSICLSPDSALEDSSAGFW